MLPNGNVPMEVSMAEYACKWPIVHVQVITKLGMQMLTDGTLQVEVGHSSCAAICEHYNFS